MAATYRDDDQVGWVLYREDGETVEDMFAVVLVEERLILAKLEGNLNELMAKVASDHRAIPDLFDGTD